MSYAVPKLNEIFEQRYELLELLGAGGIGSVYKARQIDADRIIALKLLHPQLAEDEEFKQRFLREARALNALSHPHIVTVYHLGVSEHGLPYIAMEYIHGKSLRKVLSTEGKLSFTRAAAITKQLCLALDCMHQQGIIHRDLKPENIVLGQEPEADFVKIIDFGLVRIGSKEEMQKLTATGLLIGSAQYMSPEQSQGKKAELQSDLYSLSICFFEMLTGKAPFNADTAIGVMYKQINDVVPVLRAGEIDSQIDLTAANQFFGKALHKSPQLRFQSAAELQEQIDKLLAANGDSSANGVRSVHSGLLLVVLAFFVLGAILASTLLQEVAREEPDRLANEPVLKRKIEQTGNNTIDKSRGPFGKRLGRSQESIDARLQKSKELSGQKHYREALAICKAELALTPEKEVDTRYEIYMHFVRVYREMGDFDKAIEYSKRAAQVCPNGISLVRVKAVDALCRLLVSAGKKKEGLAAFEQELQRCERISTGDGDGSLARAYTYFAAIQLEQNNLALVKKYSKRALQEFDLVNDRNCREAVEATFYNYGALMALGEGKTARAVLEKTKQSLSELEQFDSQASHLFAIKCKQVGLRKEELEMCRFVVSRSQQLYDNSMMGRHKRKEILDWCQAELDESGTGN